MYKANTTSTQINILQRHNLPQHLHKSTSYKDTTYHNIIIKHKIITSVTYRIVHSKRYSESFISFISMVFCTCYVIKSYLSLLDQNLSLSIIDCFFLFEIWFAQRRLWSFETNDWNERLEILHVWSFVICNISFDFPRSLYTWKALYCVYFLISVSACRKEFMELSRF